MASAAMGPTPRGPATYSDSNGSLSAGQNFVDGKQRTPGVAAKWRCTSIAASETILHHLIATPFLHRTVVWRWR